MMHGNYPQSLIQALKYFESTDQRFYYSQLFRGPIVRSLFEEKAKEKIGSIIRIPFGLRKEDPDIDNIADLTFDDVAAKLDGQRIAEQTFPLARYATCCAFVMKVATNHSIDFWRKNPHVWDHGDLADDLIGKGSVTQDAYRSFAVAVQADSEEEQMEARIRQTLYKFLLPVMSERDFELYWLLEALAWDYEELSKRFKKSKGALRVRISRLRAKARVILDNPLVRKPMLGEDHDKYN